MATTTITQLVDDLSGEPGDDISTVRFTAFGVNYEIDLSAFHAGELEAALEPYIVHARRSGGRVSKPKLAGAVDARAVRRWAFENGIDVPERGRVSKEIVQAYLDAA